MTPKPKRPSALVYAEALEVLGTLGELVRARQAAHDATAAVVKQATEANAATYSTLHDAIVAYRELSGAIADNAGLSKGPTLTEALTAARAVLGGQGERA